MAWYRECAEPPLLPTHTPQLTDRPVTNLPVSPAPPAPAPQPEQIHALISDAASQARAHLRDATRLECAQHEDALRLAAALPSIRLPETAERLGIDIADLRAQLSEDTAAVQILVAVTGEVEEL